MDTNSNEKLRVSSAPERHEGPKKPEAVKEIKKKAAEVMQQAAGVDAAESQEGAEAIDGKVSEVTSEDKAYAPAASGKRSYSADEIESIRAKLLAALPPHDVMIREIRKKLHQEEKVLTKRMNKLKKNAHRQAFYLVIVVTQLRKLREYFSVLAHATYEMVKHLWLKIVHGV